MKLKLPKPRTNDHKILNRLAPQKLPHYDNAVDLANKFADFFVQKVETIRNSLNSCDFYPDEEQVICPAVNELHSLSPKSVNELSALLGNTSTKSCILDPLPGNNLKTCINTLLPTFAKIANLSFTEASVPEILKQSVLEPRIEKPLLDNELLSNYYNRPISNLKFISKAIEKVSADRLIVILSTMTYMGSYSSLQA